MHGFLFLEVAMTFKEFLTECLKDFRFLLTVEDEQGYVIRWGVSADNSHLIVKALRRPAYKLIVSKEYPLPEPVVVVDVPPWVGYLENPFAGFEQGSVGQKPMFESEAREIVSNFQPRIRRVEEVFTPQNDEWFVETFFA